MAKRKVKITLKDARFFNMSVDFYGADKDDILMFKEACQDEDISLIEQRYDYGCSFVDYEDAVVEVEGEEYSSSLCGNWGCLESQSDGGLELNLPKGMEEGEEITVSYLKEWVKFDADSADSDDVDISEIPDYLYFFTSPKGYELFRNEVLINRNEWNDYKLSGEIELEEGETFDPSKFCFISKGRFYFEDENEDSYEFNLASAYGFVYDGKWYPFSDDDDYCDGLVGYYTFMKDDTTGRTCYQFFIGDYDPMSDSIEATWDCRSSIRRCNVLLEAIDSADTSDSDSSSSSAPNHEEFLKKFIEYADIKMLKADKPNHNYVKMYDEKMKALKCELLAKVTLKEIFVNFLYDKSLGKAIYDDIVANHKAEIEKNVSRFGVIEWVSNEGKHPYVKVSKTIGEFASDDEKFAWLKDVVLNLYNSMSAYLK